MNTANNLYQCRLCLKRTSTKINVFGGDFPKMLEILTSIKVRENDGLPKYSCTKCAHEVKMALIIKKRIIKAHKTLLENLRIKKEKKEQNITRIIICDDDSPVSETISLANIEGSINASKNRGETEQKIPIEFVNVGSPEISKKTKRRFDAKLILDKMKIECEDICVGYNTEAKEYSNEDVSLQEVIDKAINGEGKPAPDYTCQDCNITFEDKPSYSLHSAKHKKTECHICNRVVRTDNFKKHVMLHTAGPTKCTLCDATCKNIESLRGHIFYQHKSSADTYICEECGKAFRIKYKFLLHKKKEHSGLRNFKCTICGKAFFTNGNLITHVNMTHKKLRPHICEFCGTGYSSSYALKTHKRQHTNEKPFKCVHCNDGFRQRVSLRAHLKSKHGVEEAKEFFCAKCDKGFATNYALNIHQRLHMSEKCDVCSETFAEEEYLKNHLKDVHNIILEEFKEELDT